MVNSAWGPRRIQWTGTITITTAGGGSRASGNENDAILGRKGLAGKVTREEAGRFRVLLRQRSFHLGVSAHSGRYTTWAVPGAGRDAVTSCPLLPNLFACHYHP